MSPQPPICSGQNEKNHADFVPGPAPPARRAGERSLPRCRAGRRRAIQQNIPELLIELMNHRTTDSGHHAFAN